MKSSKRASMGTTYISERRISQWEDLMKKFSVAHKEKCKTVPLDIPRASRSVKKFPTGSQYKGTWDVLGMSGYGEYNFPHGVTYEGDTEDGMFHGKGELRYQNGATIRGKWNKGVMTERMLLFSDSLEYHEDTWKYCIAPDRRFAIEYEFHLMPAGNSYLTADQPTREIPPGYYDTGDGFYNPNTKVVFRYDNLTSILRSPSKREQKWIVDNCRQNPREPLGPRPDLYEEWSEPLLTLPLPPPPSAGVKFATVSSRQHSMFKKEFDFGFGTPFYETERNDPEERCFRKPKPFNMKSDPSDLPLQLETSCQAKELPEHVDNKEIAHLCFSSAK